ncbi:MAG: histidinol-phosphate transaminase [bacterium]
MAIKPDVKRRAERELPALRPHLKTMQPYPPGKPIEEVQREYGLSDIVKLASNENPIGPSPKAAKAMRDSASEINRYPDGYAYALRHALAKFYGLQPDQFLFGNGSDEIFILLALSFLSPSENIVVSDLAFVRYQMAAQLVGAKWESVKMRDWRHDLPGFVRAIGPTTRMVCLSNPNNPVGTYVTRAELEAFLPKIPRNILIILDEAYFEYSSAPDYPNGLDYLAAYPNLVVTRTFSKAYGLAGLRVGYAMGCAQLLADVERVRPPFNVNLPAQRAAVAALKDQTHVRRVATLNRREMKFVTATLSKIGLRWIPSATNFVLIDTGLDGKEVTEKLLRRGVIVRPMGGYCLPRHIRVTFGTRRENQKFLKALSEVLKEKIA